MARSMLWRWLVPVALLLFIAVLAVVTLRTERGKPIPSLPAVRPPESIVVAVAGDIADNRLNAAKTARLIEKDKSIKLILTTGDNAYDDGSPKDFRDYYATTWGAFRSLTRPSPGNHDLHTAGGAGYYGYYGPLAGPKGRGYYSFDLGNWHFVSLDSKNASASQIKWFRADLAQVPPKKGIIAYWHYPLFNSGAKHGDQVFKGVTDLWKAVEGARADLVLNGHDHNYQRYRQQDRNGQVPAWGGIRQFVVGTGGAVLNDIGRKKDPGYEFGVDSSFGILKLYLGANSYSWEFVDSDGLILDSGGPVPVHE